MLLSALILGLLGSFHCVGMCGPIAFMLPVDRSNSFKKVTQIAFYHFGRLVSYSIIGFVFGLLGKGLYIFGLQQQLSIIIGVLMIIVVIIPYNTFNKYNFSKPIFKFISKIRFVAFWTRYILINFMIFIIHHSLALFDNLLQKNITLKP